MRFVCQSCQAKYSIADERVQNRVVRLKCQKCQAEITLRGPTTGKASIAAEPKNAGATTLSQVEPIGHQPAFAAAPNAVSEPTAPDRQDDLDEPRDATQIASLSDLERIRKQAMLELQAGPKKVAPAAPPPKPAEPKDAQTQLAQDEWFVLVQGQQEGPLGLDAIRALAAAGRLTARSYGWREGMGEWQRLAAIPAIKAVLPPEPPAATKPLVPTSVPPPVRAAKSHANMDDLFAPDGTEEAMPPVDDQPLTPFADPARPSVKAHENTGMFVAAAGLVERDRRQKRAFRIVLAVLLAIVTVVLLDVLGVVQLPGMGLAYEVLGVESPHKSSARGAQFEGKMSEEEKQRIRDGLLGKKPEAVTAPSQREKVEDPPKVAASPKTAPSNEQKLLAEVLSDDQKAEVKLEPPRLKTPEQKLPQGIGAEQIGKVVEGNQKAIKFCFERALKKGAELGGKMEIEFTIAASGAVSAFDVKTPKLKGTEFAECVGATVKSWKFPAFTGDSVSVEYPFILSAGI